MIIDLNECSYPVEFEKSALENTIKEILNDGEQLIIIIDENIFQTAVKLFPPLNDLKNKEIIKLPSRKESKTTFTLLKILSHLELINFPRSGTIIAIGGGVIGDISGLAASLWYRGCNLIHVPSTLLAAVDSCVGGKTALNFRNTINAIGTYYHPKKIIISTELLHNLPKRELSSGMAEVIKYTVIGNKELLDLINSVEFSDLKRDNILKKIIQLSLNQKANFVRNDIKESGKRLFLNLGHTIGHAIEVSSIYSGYEQLRHGEAVALGLVAVSHISTKLNKLENKSIDSLSELLRKYNLPVYLKPTHEFNFNHTQLVKECIEATFRDKKRTKSNLRLILPINNAENCEIYESSSDSLIEFGIRSVVKDS